MNDIITTADLDGMTNRELFDLAMTCENPDGSDAHCIACEAFAVWTYRVSDDVPSMRD